MRQDQPGPLDPLDHPDPKGQKETRVNLVHQDLVAKLDHRVPEGSLARMVSQEKGVILGTLEELEQPDLEDRLVSLGKEDKAANVVRLDKPGNLVPEESKDLLDLLDPRDPEGIEVMTDPQAQLEPQDLLDHVDQQVHKDPQVRIHLILLHFLH